MDKRIVLIIEDSPQDAELLRQILLKAPYNFEPLLFPSVEEAIPYLNDVENGKHKKPVLVLLDLYFPGARGLDFLNAFHKDSDFKDTPVIVMTASEEHEDLIKSYKLGAACFMKKPYRMNEILEVLAQLKLTGRF